MDGLTGQPFRAMPDEAPLSMPVQSLWAAPERRGRPPSAPPRMWLRRLIVIGGAILLTGVATQQMVLALSVTGLTALEWVILVLFVALFAWIALALVSGVCGFVSVLAGGGRRLDPGGMDVPPLAARTAVLMPAYNESP
ncbi:MAG TPA: glucan biosynthesis glucosyltransferase H, partial [Acetobacteraceae bacterium]|nr:glucan biosynthesis glucosyltransferase H [Acetobacteraceae bacterium]